MFGAKKVRLLYLIALVDLFACSMAVPLLSVHMRSLGASHFTVGILSSLYAGLQLISSPVIGSWSDVRGHSFVLQLTLLLSAILYFALGTVTAIPVIALIRIGLGLLKHTQTLCRTLLTDVASTRDQLIMQSRLVSFGSVGFIVGPVVGGHMAEMENGFHYVCCIVMLFFLINFAIVHFFLSNTPQEHKKNDTILGLSEDATNLGISTRIWTDKKKDIQETSKESSRALFRSSDIFQAVTRLLHIRWSVYWDVFTLKFLLGFAQAVHYQSFSLILKEEYSITPSGIGYTISFQGLVGATAGFLSGGMGRFYKKDKYYALQMLHGFGVLTLSFILLSLKPNLTFFLVCLIPVSASSSLLRIVTSEVILQRTAPNQRGSLIGSGQSMSSVARLIAPLCSGLAYDKFGFCGTSMLRIAVTITALSLSSIMVIHQRKNKFL
ncbi:Major facilitator superfamily domain-containing protein 9 [Cryptotermes secundus]|uniref:Major facilitator superfamily domain-containing protein 9 n=1 Tax=Cryptotermes secundus TaxID=105785 RepID=A0A2J7RN81_9NEOP|nr:major facilitator superfamily domain-containing protein 9 [Cryptotermes secundus]PNF42296.1 Major facilitator superfamily domain-containing protein 9 [Cryptotermes secundus]